MQQPYPFGRKDQLDFEFEWVFPPGDIDTISSVLIFVDPGILLVGQSQTGNTVKVWIKLDPAVSSPEWAILGVTCVMIGSSSPPRKIERTITIQVTRP